MEWQLNYVRALARTNFAPQALISAAKQPNDY